MFIKRHLLHLINLIHPESYASKLISGKKCYSTVSQLLFPNGNEINKVSDSVENYWPNCDTSIWMRSCDEEVIDPLKGHLVGKIPSWLSGTLLRNGPGSLRVGQHEFKHLFDSSALLHKFEIANGDVTYQRRFVDTDVRKKNQAAQRIVMNEFGTQATPDPCHSIFQRVAALFNPGENASDNSMISIYPFGDEFYTFAEFPVIHRIDPDTLETLGKVNISNYVGIVNHTSHPHVMKDGTVFNVGQSVSSSGPAYNIVQFTPSATLDNSKGGKGGRSMFDEAKIVGSIPARWKLNPSYMHTFGVTDNYFIIVEQPLGISFLSMVGCHVANKPLAKCLKWHDNQNTLIHLISRHSGQLERTFTAETFFFLHIINQFETPDGNYVVIDICCYKDAKMLDCMYIDVMKNMHKNPDYSSLFRGRPLRFILPVNYNINKTFDQNILELSSLQKYFPYLGNKKLRGALQQKPAAHILPDGQVFVKPELLADLGCETPRFNYFKHLGKPYQFFYAISSDVDLEHPGTIIKVDTKNKSRVTWSEKNLYPSEPIFVPRPGAQEEDDGVVLSAAIFGQTNETDVCLLVLDAKTMNILARCTFSTPGSVPKCLHGWFIHQ